MYTTRQHPAARECSQLAGIPPHRRDTGSQGGCKCCPRAFCTTDIPAHPRNWRGAAERPGWAQAHHWNPPYAAWQEVPRDGRYWPMSRRAEHPSRKVREAAVGNLQLKRERTGLKSSQMMSSPAKGCEGTSRGHKGQCLWEQEGKERKATKPQAIVGGCAPEFPVFPHHQHLLIPKGSNNDFSTLGVLPAWGGLFCSVNPCPLLFNPRPLAVFHLRLFFYHLRDL